MFHIHRLIEASHLDVIQIASLAGELGYPTNETEILDRLRNILSRPDHLVLVARSSDELIAWIHMERCISIEGGEKAEIQGLVVASSARRTGVGKALVAKSEEWAFDQGLSIVVRSNVKRDEAHDFYAALGYERSKSQHVHHKRFRPSA